MQPLNADGRHTIVMNDKELVNQIKKGNANAYRFLVSKYQRLVFNVAWRMVNQQQAEVEDIAQEVFIKVYKNINKFKGQSKLSTWIASIAWKTSVDHIRKKHRTKLNFTDEPEIFETATNFSTDEHSNLSEMKKMVHETLKKLPVHYQTVLTLFYLEEFSLNEIQEITEMPMGTIKSYLSRARNIFKAAIIDTHGDEALNLLHNDN